MKQGNLLNRGIMLLLLAAILIYLGVSAWNSFTDPFATVLSYAYTIDDAVETTGFLVRQESLIPGTGAIVDLTRSEGERVAKGESVAVIYQSSAAADRRAQIHALQLEREQLQYSLHQDGISSDSARLSQDVIGAIVALRSSVATGDLTRLEDETMSLKSLVYKRDAIYAGTTDNLSAIQDAIDAVDKQLTALNGQAMQDTNRVTVAVPGVFSGQVDGYESLLTPSLLPTLTPGMLDRLATQKPPVDLTAIGKLITSSTWYFICPVPQSEAARFVEGHEITVNFSRDWSGQVNMTVEKVSMPENGRVTLTLSTSRYLSETTLLRRQTVDLVFGSKAGIRVPKSAVRVGADGTTGVYALVGARAEYKAIEVVDQRDDYCIVIPIQPADSKDAKKILRAGDEIIVAAADLFDGMVVQ